MKRNAPNQDDVNTMLMAIESFFGNSYPDMPLQMRHLILPVLIAYQTGLMIENLDGFLGNMSTAYESLNAKPNTN